MKSFLDTRGHWIFAALLLVCASFAQSQTLVRYTAPFPSVSQTSSPFLVANLPPNSPILAVCKSPANTVPCTNYATTYTGNSTACPNGAQDTPDPGALTSACQPQGDAWGNIGFWAPAGTYDYTVCISNTCLGPYTVTLGGAGGGGGGPGTGLQFDLADWATTTTLGSVGNNISGQSVIFQNNAPPVAASPGLIDSTTSPVSSSSYLIRCDGATSIFDRSTTIPFVSGASVINLPVSSGPGCYGMAVILENDNAGLLTVNATSPDVIRVINGATTADNAASFTFNTGNFVSLNQSSPGTWTARITKSSSGSGGGNPTLDNCTPDQTGNSFYNVTSLTNYFYAGWAFVPGAASYINCTVYIPTAQTGATIVLDIVDSDTATGPAHTATFQTCDAVVNSGTINLGSALTCASSQTFTTTATAYSRATLTFNVQSTLSNGSILVIKIATATSGTQPTGNMLVYAHFIL
jgi:hypothetical protein